MTELWNENRFCLRAVLDLAAKRRQVTAARAFLIEALQRVAGDGDITARELDAAIHDPLFLDPTEKKAWEQLSHWADDRDIREADERYATFKREWMKGHIAVLKADGD